MTLAMRHILRSERGASMSMALMTFLVCTMVASVTITAATVVIGRQKTIEEADTSYYNVTCAAKIFWDELADDKVTCKIKRSCSATFDGNTFSPVSDSWRMSVDTIEGEAYKEDGGIDHALKLDKDTATFWQILSVDLALGGKHPNYVFEVKQSDVDFDIADGDSSPSPPDDPIIFLSYDPIRLTVQDDSTIPAVLVTVNRDVNGDFRFVFEQEKGNSEGADEAEEDGFNRSFKATLLARANVNTSIVRRKRDLSKGTYTLSWDTEVTWERISMNVGGA